MLNLVYHTPNGDDRELESFFKSSFSKQGISHKDKILAGKFNINLLNIDVNKKVSVNLMFRFGMIPTINKPTCVARQTASTIDHIITNSIMHSGFKSGIIKTHIYDYFPIFFCCKQINKKEDAQEEFTHKRRLSDQSIGTFKKRLRDINWSKVRQCRNGNEEYISPFEIQEVSTSPPKKGEIIRRYNQLHLNKEKCKTHKSLFQSIKRKSKKSYFSK